MARNIEVKARAGDLAAVRRRVEALGGAASAELTQVDTFFDVPSTRLKLREFGDGTGELISYSRADHRGPKVSTYAIAKVRTPTDLGDVLSHALGVRASVRKRRTVFLLGQTRIHLDEVDGLGTFVELEVVLRDDQSEQEGQRIATDLLDALSIPVADLVEGAYIDLLQQKTGS